jgi:hypothetical protein
VKNKEDFYEKIPEKACRRHALRGYAFVYVLRILWR